MKETKNYKEEHTYYCELQDPDGKYYIGKARCCPEDYDFENDLTGFTLAEGRALIKAMKGAKIKARHELNILKQYYNRIRYNKYYNEKHQPYSTIIKMLTDKEEEINLWQFVIDDLQNDLDELIKEKEQLYQKIRGHRSQDENE